MALSATFTANFSSFYDAVEKADTKLKDFGAGADKVGGRLTALGNSFSGVKIIQDATLMVKAVEDIGGASKLTEKEMQRLGATTNEAVAKMKALGMDVPKNLQEIADKTKVANKSTTDWMGSLTKIAATLGIAFSVDAIKGFISSVFDAAGAVKDLSDQWGVSTKFVQQWGAAAKESGIDTEQLGKSIQYMTEKLSESSPEYVALLKNVGLSADALRKMSTEEGYKQVIKAIAGITDETKQLDIAMGILGPNAKKIIGGIRDGLYEAADAQKFMSDETIKRLDKAGDAWAKFKNNVIIQSGEILAEVQKTSESSAGAWGQFLVYAAEGYGKLTGYVKKVGKDIELAAPPAAALNAELKTTAEVTADLKKKNDDLAASEKARAQVQADAKKAQDDWNKRLQDEYNAAVDLRDTFAGGGLISTALKYVDALKTAIPIEEMTAKQQENIHQVMEDALEVYAAAGKDAPDAMYKIWTETLKVDEATVQTTEDLGALGDAFLEAATKGKAFDPTKIGPSIKIGAAPPPGTFDNFGEGIAGALSGSIMKAIQGGGSILQAAGSSIGNFLLDPKQSGVGKAIETAAQKLPSFMGSAISAALPVVGSLIGPAVSWLGGKIMSFFGKSDAEKLRDQFINAAGGVEALTVATRAAGTNLDALFQGRSADAVNKAIGDINTALASQADAYQVALETAQKYGFTIEELGPAMARQELDKQAQQLYKDWQVLNSAGIDTVAITTRMSESVSQYVQDASAMGTEVPEAMRPMLDAMVKSGTLLDENGDAITDLDDAGIKFSLSMSDGFKKLIDKVGELTDAISRSLGIAIKEIPQPEIVGTVRWDVQPVETEMTARREGGSPIQEFQQGSDGFRNFGKGTPVMLHGWEAVVPRDDAGAFATVAASSGGASAAAMAPTVIVNAQGAFFDTPESLQRLANKVGDALTAKFSVMGKLRAAV